MTSCKEIDKPEKRTVFDVRIDISDFNKYSADMVKYLRAGRNNWMVQLADIIEKE